jgi:hypothetical protein
MDRKNDAYMAQQGSQSGFVPLDSTNPGVEYLKTVDSLTVKHVFSCWEGELK